MRGVCALNFEAMNILTPQGKDEHMNQLEQEMLRNFQQENLVAMNQFGHYQQTPAEDQMSQISYNLSEQSTTEMQNRFTQLQIEATTTKEKGEIRVESKDHMWKPAPLVNREFIQRELQENKASYSSQISESKPFVLPSYINNQQDYLQ